MTSETDLQLQLELNKDAKIHYLISENLIKTTREEKITVSSREIQNLFETGSFNTASRFYGTISLKAGTLKKIDIPEVPENFFIYICVDNNNDTIKLTNENELFASYMHKNNSLQKVNGLSNSNTGYEYLLSLPSAYSEDEKDKQPLLIQLHGAGSFGKPVEQSEGWVHNFIRFKNKSAVVVNPQTHKKWDVEKLDALLTHLLETYNVDKNKVYLTGYSYGGRGCFDYAVKYGNRLTALVPMAGACSFSNSELPGQLIDLPIWAFHNDGDPIVNISETQRVYDILDNYSFVPVPKFTIYDNDTHALNNGKGIYNAETLNWLFQQNK